MPHRPSAAANPATASGAAHELPVTMRAGKHLIPRYAELIYYGYWYAPEREMLQVALDEAQKDVTGTVRVKLYKGNCTVVGRKSPRSLYRLDMATFEEDDVYRQKDAEGFIRLNALRLAIRAQRQKRASR